VIHICGTPASDKSILLELIKEHFYQKYPEIVVKRIEWRDIVLKKDSNIAIPEMMGETPQSLFKTTKKCLLIDEAQLSYGDDYLWSSLIKNLSSRGNGLLIVLATSYGDATGRPAITVTTPPVLREQQRFSLKRTAVFSGEAAGLYLDLAETKDVIAMITRRERSVPFSEDLILWLHNATLGHVGALSTMVEMVFNSTVSIPYKENSKS